MLAKTYELLKFNRLFQASTKVARFPSLFPRTQYLTDFQVLARNDQVSKSAQIGLQSVPVYLAAIEGTAVLV